MLATPLVSVCIPTYNRSAWVSGAIESALRQTGVDFEVLVSDNASTDDTVDVVRSIAERDNRVRLLTSDVNHQCYPNHVKLLRHARGRYIKFLMDDDVLRPNVLASMAQHLDDDGVALVTSRIHFVDQDLRPVPQPAWTAPPVACDARVNGVDFGDHCFVHGINYAYSPSNTMFRRDDVDPEELISLGGVQFFLLGDFALWVKLMARGDVVYLVDPVADSRSHPGQGGSNPGIGPAQYIEWLYQALFTMPMGFLRNPALRRLCLVTTFRNIMSQATLDPADPWTPVALQALQLAGRLIGDLTGEVLPDPVVHSWYVGWSQNLDVLASYEFRAEGPLLARALPTNEADDPPGRAATTAFATLVDGSRLAVTTSVVEQYLRAFAPGDPVALYLCLDTSTGTAPALLETVAGFVTTLGFDPGRIPDVHILPYDGCGACRLDALSRSMLPTRIRRWAQLTDSDAADLDRAFRLQSASSGRGALPDAPRHSCRQQQRAGADDCDQVGQMWALLPS